MGSSIEYPIKLFFTVSKKAFRPGNRDTTSWLILKRIRSSHMGDRRNFHALPDTGSDYPRQLWYGHGRSEKSSAKDAHRSGDGRHHRLDPPQNLHRQDLLLE